MDIGGAHADDGGDGILESESDVSSDDEYNVLEDLRDEGLADDDVPGEGEIEKRPVWPLPEDKRVRKENQKWLQGLSRSGRHWPVHPGKTVEYAWLKFSPLFQRVKRKTVCLPPFYAATIAPDGMTNLTFGAIIHT